MSSRQTSNHLQRKVSLTLVLLISVFILMSYSIMRFVIAPAFDDLEISAARSDLVRAEVALRNDIDNLSAVATEWAARNDIRAFVLGTNPGFRQSHLNATTLQKFDLDVLAIYDAENQLVWGSVSADSKRQPLTLWQALSPGSPRTSTLLENRHLEQQSSGLFRTAIGPAIIESRPIEPSAGMGTAIGTVVMGQLLNASRQGEISSLGSHAINLATMLLVVVGLLICAVIWFMLRQTILRPIERLAAHISKIRKSGDLTRKITLQRDDEIGSLAQQFNDMTAEVNDARQELLDKSFKAGKADTAAEVMHNIRNAMTPMINGLERLRKSFRVSENLRVSDAITQIADSECPADRKQKFLEYIVASFGHIEAVGKNALGELDVISSQASQIEGILSDQEKFANVAPVAEVLVVDELLGEAANVLPREDKRQVALKLDTHLSKLRVRGYRIGLLQVMGNLILNAYESIVRHETQLGEIGITATDEIVDDEAMVRVTVQDNGTGFNSATREKIFRRGFTSKRKGEFAGLGLHWCANAVAGMGGRISAESPGEGHGAAFHVLLPAGLGT